MCFFHLDVTKSECCGTKAGVTYKCDNSEGFCKRLICKDGSLVEPSFTVFRYCGNCNIFGCDCNGGCLTNSKGTWREAFELFKARYHLKETDIIARKYPEELMKLGFSFVETTEEYQEPYNQNKLF